MGTTTNKDKTCTFRNCTFALCNAHPYNHGFCCVRLCGVVLQLAIRTLAYPSLGVQQSTSLGKSNFYMAQHHILQMVSQNIT